MKTLKLTLTEKQILTIQVMIDEQYFFEMSAEKRKHLKSLDRKLTKQLLK